MENIKPDVVLKDFWRDNERFASLFNTVVFNGEEVIRPEQLYEADTDVSNLIERGGYRETLARSRDVVKKTAQGVSLIILGIENQMKTHYAMPLRIMLYDSLDYLKEYQELSRQLRKDGSRMTAEEFLSALRKEDRLHPIISIVIYYGEEAWDGPLSLRDMIVELPEQLDAVLSDYRMNLVQVRDSGRYHFDNEDVQTVFEICAYLFNERFDELGRKYKNRDIKAELATVIGMITESEHIVEQAGENKGGYMNMCGALERLEERCREQGIERGIEQGIEQEKRKIILQMLKKGMDKSLIREITGADEKMIKELRKETLH